MRFTKGVEGVLGPVLIALVFAGYPTVLHAQTTSATVSGSVQDAQGGVLPGVTVTMTSRTQGNVLTGGHRRRWPFRLPHRPSRHLYAPGHAAGLQDGGADEPGRERERQAFDRVADPGSRPADRRSHRVEPRHPAAIGERRTFVHAPKRDVEEHREQRAGALQLRDAGARRAVAGTPATRSSARSSGFTVNGQRPNSNNITIDGVANIDTGDNGGNMATTNIDAVAEFKILTNAYQAEYGRAVGGQLQVVTKSGSQAFHGSGYWYGRRSDWDANTVSEQARDAGGPEGEDRAQRLRLHDRRADLVPGFQPGQEEAVLLLEPGIPATQQPGDACIRRACRRPSSGVVISHRASTAAATRSPTFVISAPACRAAPPTRAAVSRTAACSAGFPRTGSMRPASPR